MPFEALPRDLLGFRAWFGSGAQSERAFYG